MSNLFSSKTFFIFICFFISFDIEINADQNIYDTIMKIHGGICGTRPIGDVVYTKFKFKLSDKFLNIPNSYVNITNFELVNCKKVDRILQGTYFIFFKNISMQYDENVIKLTKENNYTFELNAKDKNLNPIRLLPGQQYQMTLQFPYKYDFVDYLYQNNYLAKKNNTFLFENFFIQCKEVSYRPNLAFLPILFKYKISSDFATQTFKSIATTNQKKNTNVKNTYQNIYDTIMKNYGGVCGTRPIDDVVYTKFKFKLSDKFLNIPNSYVNITYFELVNCKKVNRILQGTYFIFFKNISMQYDENVIKLTKENNYTFELNSKNQNTNPIRLIPGQ